ncbi:MAG: hypothetical protein INR71_16300 [Terriglobus roseus]|nr:hypothetical protein [Terriglobus roseus]
MGKGNYGEFDELAINTIRTLAVSPLLPPPALCHVPRAPPIARGGAVNVDAAASSCPLRRLRDGGSELPGLNG